ncbi:MAG: aminoglycoside phosphotransferase family protein [Fibrobacteres bacterium]|nr:aminoglycoside phosphotransferase family protein [Fibrobacterota bacterium]
MSSSKFTAEYLKEMAEKFVIDGDVISVEPYGTGHINDTFCGTFKTAKGSTRYIHQRINHNIFKNPEGLMDNVERVTKHLRGKITARGGDPLRETLTIINTKGGGNLHKGTDGTFWRTYVFVEGAKTYDKVEDLKMVYEASKAFGDFQKDLADIPGGRLVETIPDFHHTKKRFETFEQVLKADIKGRAKEVQAEVDFVLARKNDASKIVDGMASGALPERITHNDTKFNNVMIDDVTKKGICVIDLDTVMPGSPLYDFGDSVRIGTSTAVEDERDLSKVGMDIGMFERLSEGYLASAKAMLTAEEKALLAFSGKLLTFECGMRFLTDYLNGDTYFKVHRDGHNLDRCRTQFKMVSDMEKVMNKMDAIVRKYC